MRVRSKGAHSIFPIHIYGTMLLSWMLKWFPVPCEPQRLHGEPRSLQPYTNTKRLTRAWDRRTAPQKLKEPVMRLKYCNEAAPAPTNHLAPTPVSACLQKKLWSSCCCCCPLVSIRSSLRDSRSARMPSSMRRILRFWGPSQAGERLLTPRLELLPQLGRSSELATMLLPSSELLPMLGVRASTLGEPSAQPYVMRDCSQCFSYPQA